MKLTRLVLKDFSGHDHMDLEFKSGVTGIIGSNGSGKSTILNAICLAVTKENRGGGDLAQNVRWGRKSFTVTLEFEDREGNPGRVQRSVSLSGSEAKRQHTSRQTLEYAGNTYTASKDIDTVMCEIAGCSMDALLNNIFVPQGQIDSILFAAKGERLKEIQNTVGLSQAAAAEAALQLEASRYTVSVGLDAQIESLQMTVSTLLGKLSAQKAAVAEVEHLVTRLGASEALLHAVSRMTGLEATLQSRRAREASLAKELDKIAEQLTALDGDVHLFTEQLARLKPGAERARTQLMQAEVLKRDAARRVTLVAEVEAASKALEAVPAVDDTQHQLLVDKIAKATVDLSTRERQLSGALERPKLPEEVAVEEELAGVKTQLAHARKREVSDEETALRDDVGRLTRRLRLITTEKVCFECGQSVEHIDTAKAEQELVEAQQRYDAHVAEAQRAHAAVCAELERQVAELDSRLLGMRNAARDVLSQSIAKLRPKVESAKAMAATMADQLQRRKEYTATISRLQGEIQALGDPSVVDTSGFEAQVKEYDELGLRLRGLQQERERADGEQRRVSEELSVTRAELAETESPGAMPSEEEIDKARKDAQELDTRRQELRVLKDELADLSVQLSGYETTLNAVTRQHAAERVQVRWVNICKKARAALHVKAWPRLMMQAYAKVLNRRIAFYLRLWNAPFHLWLTDDLSFEMQKPESETAVPAVRLSGGEMIVAATSFRLAMADTFARSTGLLVMDEPTNYLDESNISHLQALLFKMKELAGQSGRQVLVVTHEKLLMGFFDNVIDLNQKSEEEA